MYEPVVVRESAPTTTPSAKATAIMVVYIIYYIVLSISYMTNAVIRTPRFTSPSFSGAILDCR